MSGSTQVINELRQHNNFALAEVKFEEGKLKNWQITNYVFEALVVATLVAAVATAIFTNYIIAVSIAAAAILFLVAKIIVQWQANRAQDNIESEKAIALQEVITKTNDLVKKGQDGGVNQDIVQLRREKQDLLDEQGRLTLQLQNLTRTNTQLSDDKRVSDETVVILTEDKRLLDEKVKSLTSENEKLQKLETGHEESKKLALDEKEKKHKDAIKVLQDQIETLKKPVTKDEEKEKLIKEVTDLKKDNEELRKTLDDHEKTIGKQKQEISELKVNLGFKDDANRDLISNHSQEVQRIETKHLEAIDKLKKEKELAIEELKKKHKKEIDEDKEYLDLKEHTKKLEAQIAEYLKNNPVNVEDKVDVSDEEKPKDEINKTPESKGTIKSKDTPSVTAQQNEINRKRLEALLKDSPLKEKK